VFFTQSVTPPIQNLPRPTRRVAKEQPPDGTLVLTSPTGRVYRNTPAGAELFPQLRPACAEPTPRKRSGRREKAARTALARNNI
jgi:hypothetical protein